MGDEEGLASLIQVASDADGPCIPDTGGPVMGTGGEEALFPPACPPAPGPGENQNGLLGCWYRHFHKAMRNDASHRGARGRTRGRIWEETQERT